MKKESGIGPLLVSVHQEHRNGCLIENRPGAAAKDFLAQRPGAVATHHQEIGIAGVGGGRQ